MGHIPQISDAEKEVMQVLWDRAPRTANEVIEALERRTDWKPNTVRTLLNRLVRKKAVSFSQENRMYTYYPLVSKDECVISETRSFLNKNYGGALKPFLVHFLKEEPLSKEDIEELKRILDDNGK